MFDSNGNFVEHLMNIFFEQIRKAFTALIQNEKTRGEISEWATSLNDDN